MTGKKYFHYGKEVECRPYEGIRDILKKYKSYIFLPVILENGIVVKSDGKFLVFNKLSHEYIITDSVPDDGDFGLLLSDIYAQSTWEEKPMKMQSLLKKIYDDAYDGARELTENDEYLKYNEEVLECFKTVARERLKDDKTQKTENNLYTEEEIIEENAIDLLTVKVTADIMGCSGWDKERVESLYKISDDMPKDIFDNLMDYGYSWEKYFVSQNE